MRDLLGHALWTVTVVALAPDGLGAPVTVIGTAARRHQVHREAAVAVLPETAIALDVDEVPRRFRQLVEAAQFLAASCLHESTVATERETGDALRGLAL